MQYDDHLNWAKSLVATRLSKIKAAVATNAANVDEYQQAIFDCSLSTAELGSAEALAVQASSSNHPLLPEMAEINSGLTIKSVIERMLAPIDLFNVVSGSRAGRTKPHEQIAFPTR